MRMLVTGGAGFIGSNFVRMVVEEGRDEVTVLDKLTYAGNLENLEGLDPSVMRFVRGDVAAPEDVEGVLSPGGFDAVVHFAAESHVDRSLEDPAPFIRTNVLGTQVMLDAARRAGVRRFLHISTDEVYGPLAPGEVTDEGAPLRPSSPYAASKAAADLLALAARHTWGLPVVVARASNNYGPRQHPEKMIPLFLTNALEEKPLPVYGDGLQERDWLYVHDCARAFLALVRAAELAHAVYNVSFGSPRTNMETTRAALALAGRDKSLIEHVKDRPGHDRRYAPDSTRLREEIGWKPGTDFRAGLERTARWYRENRSWWDRVKSGEYMAYYERMYGSRGAHE
jgi:dTDP-glucose 4,6-dehydratase